MNYHITPLNDLEPHKQSSTCKCSPRVEVINGSQLIIHNSFDGREGIEMAKEILAKCKEPDCENEVQCDRPLGIGFCYKHCGCNKLVFEDDED